MGNPNQIDLGGNTLVVSDIVLSSTPGGAQTSLSATEIAALDGVTPGTVSASKAVVVNSSSAITSGLSALTVTTVTPTTIAGAANFTGTPTFGSLTASGTVTGGQVSAGTIADGANVILTAAQSGSTCVFSTTTGSQFTLPTPVVGMEFYFVAEASLASGAYKFITDSGSVFLKGSCYDVVASTGVQTNFVANGTTIRAVSMNATTSGGLIGTWYRLVAKSTTVWEIYGMNYATGTVITPFATS